MKNFYRSLRYLKPYRGRIVVAVVCVVLIASLWAGGLGLILPGARILLDEQGIHGWAYQTLASDHLGVTLAQQRTAPGTTMTVDGRSVSIYSVINVVKVDANSPAKAAGLLPTDLLVGLDDGDANHDYLSDDVLVRILGNAPDGSALPMRVLRTGSREPLTVRLVPDSTRTPLLKRAPAWALGYFAHAIPDPGTDAHKRFLIFVGLLVVCIVTTLLRGLFSFIQEYLVGTAIWQGIMDLRCENYNAVLHLPTTFFSEKGVSDATSRFIQDTNELARGQNTLLGKTMVEPAKAIGSLVVALSLSWKLTLMTLVAGPPAFWMIRQLGKRMHRAIKRSLEDWSSMLAVLQETLQGIRVVKAYTMEHQERKRFFRVNRQLLKQQRRMERLDAATGPTIETLGIIACSAAAGVAGYMVFNLQMEKFAFLAWLGSLFALFDPMRKLAKVSIRFHASDAAAARIFELLDTPQEKRIVNAPSLPRHSRSLEFRDVSFRYPGTASDVLKDINLSIAYGEKVAIVGPNGSGKTTLMSLVPRLIEPASGAVLLDGQDVASASVRSLRRQIGLVTQDTVMFHATIRENIAYGMHRPRPEAVLDAARKAFVDEFVDKLPDGYETMVGEQGATLSGGQKQRIAIARAILRDPAILIFDEAMSQVDSESEQRIHQAMVEFVRGRTALMIAHRLATIRWSDRIVVMEDGRVIDSGSHDELLSRCLTYQHLCHTQFVEGQTR